MLLDIIAVIAIIALIVTFMVEAGGAYRQEVPSTPPPKWRLVCRVLTTPKCWIQALDYDPQWEAMLRDLLKTSTFTAENEDVTRLGHWRIWLPSMSPHSVDFRPGRPSRGMILYARDRYRKDVVSEPRGLRAIQVPQMRAEQARNAHQRLRNQMQGIVEAEAPQEEEEEQP